MLKNRLLTCFSVLLNLNSVFLISNKMVISLTKHYTTIILSCILVFSACKQQHVNENIVKIQINAEKSNKVDLLQVVENIQLTPLETGDNCLIGNVRGIKTDGSSFYIMDYADNPVKMFSKGGKFVSEIGHRGAGPGEYIQICDILIDRDIVSLFAWNGNKKWIRYSKSNQFLYETDMAFPFDNICQIEDNKYLTYVSNGTVSAEAACYLYCIDTNFRLLSRLDTKIYPTDIPLAVVQHHFFQTAEYTFYVKEYCDTIYTISGKLDIQPKYHLDFGKNWYSQQFLKRYHDQDFIAIHSGINQNKYVRFVNFYENDRHVLVSYYIHRDNESQHEYDVYLTVYCKNTGNTINFKGSSEARMWVDLLIHPYCVQENQFVSLIAADDLLDLASTINENDAFSEKVKACAKQIEEMDNPILVRFDFKLF